MRKQLPSIGLKLIPLAYPPLRLPFLLLRSISIVRLIVLAIVFSIIYLIFEYGVGTPHEASVFISFLLLPLLYLMFSPHIDLPDPTSRIFHPSSSQSASNSLRPSFSRSPGSVLRSLGGLDRGFVEGLFVYLLLTGWVFAYYLGDKDFFSGYAKTGWEIPIFLFLISLNVMPVDFYTKRFIQYPLSSKHGPRTAIALQTLVWLLAHIPESLWLDDLMGTVGVWVFLLFSGLITGISYERTRNVSGLMAGHVMLNAFVVLMAHLG